MFEFVDKEWKALKIKGSCAFVIKGKFRRLKDCLRRWNVDTFGWIDSRVEDVAKDINVCDDNFVTLFGVSDAQGVLSVALEVEELEKKRIEASRSFWNNLQRRECILKQKSKVAWCKEGDLNTRFFHTSLKARCRRNFLGSIDTGLGRVEHVAGVKEAVKCFFKSKYRESGIRRPCLDGVQFDQLDNREDLELEDIFTMEENTLSSEIFAFISEFYTKANLPKAISASFIALIPKVDNP
ncbi:uncharacterized protein LOC131657052 [Vicia villosa]|uniref:uncharacterized protein LOC131657052 n=1 Tax=Vicia villosa TaxID=3911 RepID=UPI00273A9CE5|nr:uncharacterized protein LOC131657052 [Vicia villosa]